MAEQTIEANTKAESVISVTPAAIAKIEAVRSSNPETEDAALWLEITGRTVEDFIYEMSLGPESSAAGDDAIEEHGAVKVVIPEASIDRLRGSTIDVLGDEGDGLKITNPNPVFKSQGGPLADRVTELMEEDINPAIASHGGRVDLVSIEDDIAFVRFDGGCQGCGMARMTLSQGIEAAIVKAIPEITSVVDVTDHSAGSDPYY